MIINIYIYFFIKEKQQNYVNELWSDFMICFKKQK
jgi:hypothetical protein